MNAVGKKARRKMKKNHAVYRQSGSARFFESLAGRFVLFFGVIAAIAAVAALVIYVILPAFSQETSLGETTSLSRNPFRDSLDAAAEPDELSYNLSSGVTEAKLQIMTAVDPYIYEDEIVFASSSMVNGALKYNKLYIYDCKAETEREITDVSVKYDNIVFPRMNDKYIVFLDSSSSGGGRICVYDRRTRKQTAVKDYLYAAPEISLDGDMISFMQQAGDDTDRLYFVNLATLETVAYRVLSGFPIAPTPVCLKNGAVIYSLSYTTEDGFTRSRVYTIDMNTGEETEKEPGKLISEIKTDGKNVVFLAFSTGMPTDLYCLEGITPKLLASDVVNFRMGDGFAAYTKDDAVYAYSFREKTHYKLNSDISRAYLCSADGNKVCFMDVTGGFDDTVNAIKYLEVNFPNG